MNQEQPKCPQGVLGMSALVWGWILSFLGGIGGLIISINILRKKEYNTDLGRNCYVYKTSSRIQAIFICATAAIMTTYLVFFLIGIFMGMAMY